MALDVSRWVAYAKARAASAVARGNRSLDRREAERAAERADKPWLRADRDAPTFEEVKARIAWEAEHHGGEGPAERASHTASPSTPPGPAPSAPRSPAGSSHGDGETPTTSVDTASRVAPDPRPPEELAAEADREGARLELERRQQAAAQRLRAIREELGGDEVPPGP